MYNKKDKLNKVRKDWIKGERSFNKHRSFDEDKFENKQKIKPKNIDISRIDDYDNLPLGLVIQCESGRYFVELLGQQNDKSKIIKTNFMSVIYIKDNKLETKYFSFYALIIV